MAHAGDIARIKSQEQKLVFVSFTEADALAIGLAIVRNLEASGKNGLVDVSLWDRQIFSHSMAGKHWNCWMQAVPLKPATVLIRKITPLPVVVFRSG